MLQISITVFYCALRTKLIILLYRVKPNSTKKARNKRRPFQVSEACKRKLEIKENLFRYQKVKP